MRKEVLNILMLEDNALDAELNIEHLKMLKEYTCSVKVIQDKHEFLENIEAPNPPDLILCDFNLPQYNGMMALEDLNSRNLLIPFIFVTGTMREEVAADAIKAGAWDYVVKDRLFRLPLAVSSVLKLKQEKELSLALQKKAQRIFKAIDGTSAQVLVLNKDFKVGYANKIFSMVTGYTLDEVVGQSIFNYFPSEVVVGEPIHFKEIIKNGRPFKGEMVNHKKDRTICYERFSFTPISNDEGEVNDYVIIKEDITQQKKIQQDLLHSQERLDLALSGANIGLWNIDIKNQKMYTDRWNAILDYEEKDLSSHLNDYLKLVHPDDVKIILDLYEQNILGTVNHFLCEHRMLTKNGAYKWVLNSGKVLDRNEKGEPLRAAGTLIDISERKEAENKLNKALKESEKLNADLVQSLKKNEQINHDLAIAKQKAEESDKLKTAFLANLSHEIRTPMNGILGFADLLKQEDLSDSVKAEYITVIEQSGERMLSIIGDLVDISKIESNQVELVSVPTNINLLLDKIYKFFSLAATKKNIELKVEKALNDEQSIIITDALKLEQILTNLINNALKFTDSGHIFFSYQLKNKMLEFCVEDTGSGIPAGSEQIIFERFRQVDKSSATCLEGTGLGLSISKAFIQLMGGEIWVQSVAQEGSKFYFTLPYNLV